MRLSMQEQNLVSIYHSGSRMITLYQLRAALPFMEDSDVALAAALTVKLEQMSDSAFAALALSPEEVRH